jgi:hypothetical protein
MYRYRYRLDPYRSNPTEQIIELFKSVYEELYNSAESVDAMKEIKAKLQTMIGQDGIAR